MFKRYTNIEYYVSGDLYYKINKNHCNSISHEENKKQINKKVNLFLKELMTKSETSSIVLSVNYDFYFKETIYCLNDKFYIQVENDDDDDDDDDIYDEGTREVNISNLISALKDNTSIQKHVSLEKLSIETIRDIDRFVYNLYLDQYKKIVTMSAEFPIHSFRIRNYVEEKVTDNYKEYPVLCMLNFYYTLIDSNDLIELILNKLTTIILSQGFTYLIDENTYYFSTEKYEFNSFETIKEISSRKNITMNNIDKLVLSEIEKDIVDKNTSNIKLNMITTSNIYAIKVLDNKFYYKTQPYTYINKYIDNDIDTDEDINTNTDFRLVEHNKYNFSGVNYMLYEVVINPKCYAPSTSYIMQIKYSLKEFGRFLFFKDNIDEKISEEEFKTLPIDIREITVYNKEKIELNV